MINVSNGSCVRRLGVRSTKAAQARNAVAALAIALTTVLFTSLFTITASINYSYQQENFRRAEGDAHGTVKNITWEQAEQFRRDPLIQNSYCRLFVGIPHDPPFNKSHVEVSYMEPNGAPHYFCAPVEGALPRESTVEAATDTHVLALLGVEPRVGAQFTMPVTLDNGTARPHAIQRTFTLSGWWEYDSAVPASNVLLPRSAAEEICALSNRGQNSMTGAWNLEVMFQSAGGIRENRGAVLGNYGYQHTEAGAENYLDIGVNWGYTGERISGNFDPMTFAAIVAILLLIIFTGYLIIYNVFQISVTNDIRFYGLLKTIGTTGKQLKRVIRRQTLLLSLVGIPAGLLLGFVIGKQADAAHHGPALLHPRLRVLQSSDFYRRGGVFPADGVSLLRAAWADCRQGFPGGGGALCRNRTAVREEKRQTDSQGRRRRRIPTENGLGQLGEEPK